MQKGLTVATLVLLAGLLPIGLLTFGPPTFAEEPPIDETSVEPTHVQGFEGAVESLGRLHPIEWGGGSLLQLKARLQTHGCLVDQILMFDSEAETWFAYSQYHGLHNSSSPVAILEHL